MHSDSEAWGSLVGILHVDICTAYQVMVRWCLTCKVEEDGHRCYFDANLPQQKSVGLVEDVSSVLIVTKKKKVMALGFPADSSIYANCEEKKPQHLLKGFFSFQNGSL